MHLLLIENDEYVANSLQAAFPSERLGMGAFRIALESVFNRYLNIFYHCNHTMLDPPNEMICNRPSLDVT